MSWYNTMNRLFSQDKSFFETDKKWVYMVNFWKFSPHLATSKLTEHICNLLLAWEDIIMSWNTTMNRLFSRDKSFYETDKKWVYWVNLWKFCPHLATSKVKLDDWTHLFQVMFRFIRMFSYANNKLQMCSVYQNQFRRRQMWWKFSQIITVHSLLSVTINDLSWQNNLYMVMF